jgi:hypothetical protein
MVAFRLRGSPCVFVAAAVQPQEQSESQGQQPWGEEGERRLARALTSCPRRQQQQQSNEDKDMEAAEEAALWDLPSRYAHTVLLGSFQTRLRLSSSAASSQPSGPYQQWAWVAQGHDALAQALASGRLLPGFTEAPLACPPSFPYPAGGEAEAGVLGAMDGWMRGIAAMRRKQQRGSRGRLQQSQQLPSYPARILAHSLPSADAADDGTRLSLGPYQLAALVTGSPYKPVAVLATLGGGSNGSGSASGGVEGQQQQQQEEEGQQQQGQQQGVTYFEYALELRGFRLEEAEDFGPLDIAGASLAFPLTHSEGSVGKTTRGDRRAHALGQSRLLSPPPLSGAPASPASPLAMAAAAAAAKDNGEEDEQEGNEPAWRAALWGGGALAHCLWRSPDFFYTEHDVLVHGRVLRGGKGKGAGASPAWARAQWAGADDDVNEEEEGKGDGEEEEPRVLRHAVVVAVPPGAAKTTPVGLRQAALRLWAPHAAADASSSGSKQLLERHAAQATFGQAGFLLPDLAALPPHTPVAARLMLPLAAEGRRAATLSFAARV